MSTMDEEIAAAVAASEEPDAGFGSFGSGTPPNTLSPSAAAPWQYRPAFEPAKGEPGDEPDLVVAKRIAAAFESIATSLQILSEAQMTLAQDAVYNTEHR
jgi:hypothetical protein